MTARLFFALAAAFTAMAVAFLIGGQDDRAAVCALASLSAAFIGKLHKPDNAT